MTAKSLRVLSWNVRISNSRKNVRNALKQLLDTYHPEVVLLQEATRCNRLLKRIAKSRGYSLYQGTQGQAAGVAVLLRADVDVFKYRSARMRRWWIGPMHGLRQRPRVFPYFRLAIDGYIVRLMNLHFPTGGPQDPAVRESLRRTRRWFKRSRPHVITIAGGDVNMGAEALRTHLTDLVGATTIPGHRADNLAVCNADGTAATLGRFGSDHEAVLYTLTIGA